MSSVVWALKDGVAFVRYQSPGKRGNVDFRSLNITLEKWGLELLVVPTPKGEISLVKAGMFKGFQNITLTNSGINDIQIPYIELSHAYYDKGQLPSALERSIIDFQLAFLGVLLREQPTTPSEQLCNNSQTIFKLKEISGKFEFLLNGSIRISQHEFNE